MSTIKIVLTEDHRILRSSIKSLLENEDDIEIVAEASNGIELLELFQNGTINANEVF